MIDTIWMDMRAGINAAQIEQAGKILKNGGLVAFPTETVYGLGGDALNAQAAEKIYAAKGRPSDNPLIVHIAKLQDLEKITQVELPDAQTLQTTQTTQTTQITQTTQTTQTTQITQITQDAPSAHNDRTLGFQVLRLADAFWPGPLTMILPKRECVPSATTGGLDTVAVRMPSHPAALALIDSAGGYIAAPSANKSGRPSPTTAMHVKEDLNGRIDVIIDGGEVGIGLESTIVDLTGEVPTILRPGYISQEMLEEVLGEAEMDRGLMTDDPTFRPKAPGMKYRHYAPKAEMIIVEGTPEAVREKIDELAEEDEKDGKKVGILASDESEASYHYGMIRSVGSRSDEITIAMHLYGLLREFDALGVERIYSEAFHTPQMGQAIMNRLIKAAGHRIIEADM